MTIWRPCAVSCRLTRSLSPEFMKRSADGFGVNVASVELTGFGGEPGCGVPLVVMNAKFTYSTPVLSAHVEFSDCPVTGFCDRLSIFSAAHHLVASQLLPAGQGAHPGG